MVFIVNPWIIVPVVLLLGLLIEIGQEWFLAMRSFDWANFRMDAIGILLDVTLTMPFRFWSVATKRLS